MADPNELTPNELTMDELRERIRVAGITVAEHRLAMVRRLSPMPSLPCARSIRARSAPWSLPSSSCRKRRGTAVSDEIAYATIRELGTRYRKREISPVEVTRALLERIEKLDPILHAFVTLTADRALEDARAAEVALRRGDESPLLGIPIAHRDIYLTRGIRTTGGSALFADWVPDEDSTVVRRWQEAGTVMLGKLITHEFAFGIQFPGHKFPAARNPWNLDHIPGGSSSGTGPPSPPGW